MNENDIIIRLASRGDGVTGDGRHVALSAPQDRLNPAGGLIHGPHHIDPPCRHYPLCGGCQLQHVDDATLADFIRDRVVQTLSSQDVFAETIMPVHLSPSQSRRRVAVRSAWAGKSFQLGFSSEKSHRIVDMAQCEIMAAPLFALLTPLRKYFAPRIDLRRNVQIKLALVDQGVDVLVENWTPDGLEAQETLTEFAQRNKLARFSIDDGYGPTSFWEPEPVTVTLGGVAVVYPPYAFLQATADGEAALVHATREIVGDAKLVADLFCGLGTFALHLSGKAKVYAAEADLTAINALKLSANRLGNPVFTEHRDLFRRPLTATELNRFQAVVIDPPRAGARDQVAQLAGTIVPKIAYVSCNPSSFARDAKLLVASGYQLKRVWPVGQFRWSSHVELVGEFVRP